MWNCPQTARKRIGLALPTNRAAERLLAVALPEFPKAPAATPPSRTLQKIVKAFASTEFRHGTCCVATDGSMQMDVAAYALVFPGAGIQITAGLPGEDQTAYRAEVEAILMVLQGAIEFVESTPDKLKSLIIVADCLSALEVAQGASGACPRLAIKLHTAVRHLEDFNVQVQFVWVPSHGKHSEKFTGHPAATELQLRQWNETADAAAQKTMQARLRGSHRQVWHLQAVAAEDWETRAISALASIAEMYVRFVDTLR
eukprot:Skav234910  [mRNA]  locus=scaffold840:823794:824564:- [translate_table: standard]